MRSSLLACSLIFFVGCGSSKSHTGDGGTGGDGGAPPEPAAGCNPIIGDDCLTPYPSSFYEVADPTTKSGVHVSIGATALPVQNNGKQILPDRLNEKDGFSPSTPFLIYFKAGVDPTNLPTNDTLAASVTATSSVQIIKADDGTRVPVMAELDANAGAASTGDRQALMLHPMTRLLPATRYIIALVGLKDTAGAALVTAPFKALRDGTTLSKALTPLKASYDDIFAKLTAAGVDRTALTLAFDVTTASDETATSHLTGMVANAFALEAAGSLGYTLTPGTPSTTGTLYQEILGTVKTPQYLADATGKSNLVFGSDGQPMQNATTPLVDTPIVIHIPQCVNDANTKFPIPTVVFGHGLFGNAVQTLQSSVLEQMSQDRCAIYIATDWIGLASSDVSNVISIVSGDLNGVYVVTDRLQQAHVNINTMTRVYMNQIVKDPALQVGGVPITDGKEIYYFGISNGGIQGGTFMGINPDIVRGVLNVPGCEWSLLMYRSADFSQLKGLLSITIPDSLDAQVAIASTQSEFDYTDPATYAPHLIKDPLPGVPAKKLLLQMSIGDAQVSNLSTEILARTIGVQGFDLELPIYGVDVGTAPLDSAYTQWDSHPSPLPPTTDTALTMDNGAHTAVFQAPLAQSQINAFMQPTGQAISVCSGGVCSISQ
jgi:hypothetical protein